MTTLYLRSIDAIVGFYFPRRRVPFLEEANLLFWKKASERLPRGHRPQCLSVFNTLLEEPECHK